MKRLWQQLDKLLRSRETFFQESALEQIRIEQLVILSVMLAAIYGFFMGWYSVFSRPQSEWMQIVACLWKVPALFLLTLFICFPSLYVFSTLLGSRLAFGHTLKLLMIIVTITVTVLASFGPIVAFFSLTTTKTITSYHFMKLLNVAFFAVGGFFGVGALLKGVKLLLTPPTETLMRPETEKPVSPPPLLLRPRLEESRPSDHSKAVFRIWIFIYAMVGAQMGWILRPFLGHPGSSFTWFRVREANFFADVWRAITELAK
jgi:hypothetical protein